MADSMIERVARRLCAITLQNPDGYHGDQSLAHAVDQHWREYISTAKAVIKEMREPTEGMKRVFCSARPDSPKTVWHEVIDEALNGA